jgi:hypothetical protein
MPDRAAVFIVELPRLAVLDTEVTGIYLSTDDEGEDWPELLRLGLTGMRPNAPQGKRYLIRLLVSTMCPSPYEGGVSTLAPDVDHDIIVVDLPARSISFVDKDDDPADRMNWKHTLPIEEFCDQVEATYP